MPSLLRIIVILTLITTGCVKAHTVEQIYLSLEKSDHSLLLNITFDAGYSLPEFRDDPTSPQPSREWLIARTPVEHERLRTNAASYLRESIQLMLEDEILDYQISFPDYSVNPPEFPSLLNGGAYFTVYLTSEISTSRSGAVRMSIIDGERPDFTIAIQQPDETNYIVIEPGKSTILYSITASGEIEHPAPHPMAVFWLGFRHVLPDGLDHVLFILGLFLMARRWQALVTQSLIFTLAHSISLGLAASGILNIQNWPCAWLIEPMIALSIVAIAVENLFYQEASRRRLLLVFAFGLIHGLGFAGSLGALLHHEKSLKSYS